MALSSGVKSGESRWGWRMRQSLFWFWLVSVTSLVLVYSVPEGYDLATGDVASQNVLAPRELSYVSEILSRQAQEDAARRVPPRYTSPNPMVAREQYNRARAVLSFLRAVRADGYGADVQRSHYVWAVPELSDLPEDTVLTTLRLPDASWSRVQLEFLDLLDQVMRQEEIRESELVLIRQRIPTLIPLDLAQDEAEVLEGLVSRFVRPNVYYDEAATISATEAARQAVVPAVRQFRSGEVIVREGTVVSALDLEALTQYGLTTASDEGPGIGVAVLLAAACVAVGGLFVHHLQPLALDGGKSEVLIVLVLTVHLVLAWMLLGSGELVPYLYPGAAAGMLVATTVGPVPAIASVVFLGVVSGWIGAHSLATALMVALGGLVAVLTLPRYEQTGPLFRSGIISGLVQALVVFVFSVDELTVSPYVLLLKLGISVFSGLIAGGLTVGGLFVLTPLFDLTTTFRLTELARPNHPLLQRLLREAPATFNHVMMVTSLAEQAAERIGANALLTRVGAYYHDVGKLARPYFFVENQ
ncbi:MAG: HDIG domain-containing metalloprotein, partial [Anaerolineae bacterium]